MQVVVIAEIMREIVQACVAGAAVVELCEKGDKLILDETSKVYKKEKEMKKGKEHLHNYVQSYQPP